MVWHQAEKLATLSALYGTCIRLVAASDRCERQAYGIPSFRCYGHLSHALSGIREVANVKPSRRIMMISELDRGGVEVQVLR